MNMKTLLIAPITVLLLGVSGAGLAATSSDDAAMPNQSGMMQGGNAPRMGHMMRGGMNNGGMMGSGMMGNCPMMGEGGPNAKVMMQMRGEMMRAMGDIMIKYADKFEVPSSPASK